MFFVGGSVFGYAAWSAVSAKELPQPPADSYPLVGCPTSLSTETAHRMGYAWIGVLGFDVMILTLTIWKGYESCRKGNCVPERRRRGLIPTFVCDGVLYFLVVAVANLGNIMSYLFAPPYLRGVGSTMTTVLSTIMASRLMLNIRDPKLVSPGTFPTTMIGETRTSVIDDIPITTVFPYYGTGFSWTDEDAYGYYPYDGRSLDFSKDELITSGAITPQLAMTVLRQPCDDVWTFIVKQASLKMEQNEVITTPRIKIIVCKNGDAIEAGKK
ncbi:Transcription initiation factor IIA gamma subunit [Mycena venus]|uniref:Transcription initiation factor IIA gamma subunit n=1 Tax=Mycena venus TaxID=2733690 RepID=A0A8H6Y1L7_9AGAR|nr:Transcription initiation factor IIA gamma subunit [Mycena venus]